MSVKDFSEGALQPADIIGSIIGAVIALMIYRAVNHAAGVASCTERRRLPIRGVTTGSEFVGQRQVGPPMRQAVRS